MFGLNDLDLAHLKRVRSRVAEALAAADALVGDLNSAGAPENAIAHATEAQKGLQEVAHQFEALAVEARGEANPSGYIAPEGIR